MTRQPSGRRQTVHHLRDVSGNPHSTHFGQKMSAGRTRSNSHIRAVRGCETFWLSDGMGSLEATVPGYVGSASLCGNSWAGKKRSRATVEKESGNRTGSRNLRTGVKKCMIPCEGRG